MSSHACQELFDITSNLVEEHVIPGLNDYIRIPNQSHAYDPNWESSGTTVQALNHFKSWLELQQIQGASWTLFEKAGVPPLALVEIQSNCQIDQSIVFYTHVDKQPPGSGWETDPYEPIRTGNKLFGRGAADNGPGFFGAVTAVKALQQRQVDHGKIFIIVESEEESGSFYFHEHLENLKARLGVPSLIVDTDAVSNGYQNLWCINSLRGATVFDLTVNVLQSPVHSGHGSGVFPSSFRIIRQLLDRIEDSVSGEITLSEIQNQIPNTIFKQAAQLAEQLEDDFLDAFRVKGNLRPLSENKTEILINRSWKSQLVYLGADGFQQINECANILLPSTTLRIQSRLAPNIDPEVAMQAFEKALTAQPPYNCQIVFQPRHKVGGWFIEELPGWLENAWSNLSMGLFNKDFCYVGGSGGVPVISILSKVFPDVPILSTGVPGPDSQMHGPNENVDIEYMKKWITALSGVIAAHSNHQKETTRLIHENAESVTAGSN